MQVYKILLRMIFSTTVLLFVRRAQISPSSSRDSDFRFTHQKQIPAVAEDVNSIQIL